MIYVYRMNEINVLPKESEANKRRQVRSSLTCVTVVIRSLF